MVIYYFDTCIWRDFYEARTGLNGKPLGKYASELFFKIIKNKDILLYSDLVIRELQIDFDRNEINNMFNILFILKILKKVDISQEDYLKSEKISVKRNLPKSDVFHALIACRNGAILISQDKHLQKLKDIVKVKKPEEII